MDRNKEILKYIKLYTGCNDHTLKRIELILEEYIKPIIKTKVVEKIVMVDKMGRMKQRPSVDLKTFSSEYFKKNNTTYEEINRKCRKTEIVSRRNKYLRDAFLTGYTASELGRYLNRDHTTILNSIYKSKKFDK